MKTDLLMTQMLLGVYWFDEALQAALTSAGWPTISRTQSLLFANIAGGEKRATRLAENLGISRQYMSQVIAELEERGWIEVTVDPADRRARVIDFSTESEPLRHAAQVILSELERELKARLGSTKIRAMQVALSSDWGPPPIVRLVPAASTPGPPPPPKPRKART